MMEDLRRVSTTTLSARRQISSNLLDRVSCFQKAFTAVSSCSPSRSCLLTGLPTHQNGMYGLHQGVHAFQSFQEVKSLPLLLSERGIRTGRFFSTLLSTTPTGVGTLTRSTVLFAKSSAMAHRTWVSYLTGRHSATTPVKSSCPPFVPDTPAAREDIAAQYTTVGRLDQGVGLVLAELEAAGFSDNTLVIYSSDNGIPFPNGRTNFYEPGIQEPMIVRNPEKPGSAGARSDALVSLLDIVPTVLEWFSIPVPQYTIFKKPVTFTGSSLLPLLAQQRLATSRDFVYASHNLHEITMYYPSRMIRTPNMKLIHNLNYKMPFPIDQDFYVSPTFQDLLNRTERGEPLHWSKTLDGYYYRDEWELYDLDRDPNELSNVAGNETYAPVLSKLKQLLFKWQQTTNDPWICAPHSVLEDSGSYKQDPKSPASATIAQVAAAAIGAVAAAAVVFVPFEHCSNGTSLSTHKNKNVLRFPKVPHSAVRSSTADVTTQRRHKSSPSMHS
ncbi:hypothetical protein MTO96_041380 [Rhipicephalus appendiculatus]